jgi:RNA polymerase sigma-70 factor (ECF subfamily)
MTASERMEHVGKLRPQLIRFARTRLLNRAHAEDAVQETLLAAIENIDSFSGSSSLYSWLTGILKHKIVDCVRRSAREQWQEMDNDGTPLNPDGFHISGFGGPEQTLARRQFWEALLHCVRDLPERTADTFVLREFVGMNTAETCRALALSESNCAVMLHRARASIRASLAPELIDP